MPIAFLPKFAFEGLEFGCKYTLEFLVGKRIKVLRISIAVNDGHLFRQRAQVKLATFLVTLRARTSSGEARV